MHPNANGELVLETLPSGEMAWLRPEPERYVLTQRGLDDLRRAEAMANLFGHPWPRVSEVVA